MNAKLIIGTLIGAIVYFILGFLLYGILLMDMMNSYSNPACMRGEGEMDWVFMILGNLGFAFLLAYIFSKWANISTLAGGATGGAIIGFLVSFSVDCMIYSTSTMMTSVTGVVLDVVIGTVMASITGSVIGWWLGRK